MQEFLLHIYHEEMPMCEQSFLQYENLQNKAIIVFKKFGINLQKGDILLQFSYIRLILKCNLPQKVSIPAKKIKGPKISANDTAISGFMGKYNVKKADLTQEDDYFYYEQPAQSYNTKEIVLEITQNLILEWQNIWTSCMLWQNDIKWPRPIREINVIFGSEVMHGKCFLQNLSNEVLGAKFTIPQKRKTITNYAELSKFFQDEKIVLNEISSEVKLHRNDLILGKIKDMQNAHFKQDLTSQQLKIVDKITCICETPYILQQKIENIDIDSGIIIAIMQDHLAFVPILEQKKFSGKFVVVIDKTELDKEQERQMAQGNQLVLVARIKDAEYFYKQDISHKIEYFESKLSDINFHEKLGNAKEVVSRAVKLLEIFPKNITDKYNTSKIAATLQKSKLDLASSIVNEFPELQGYINNLYFNKENDELFREVSIYQYSTLVVAVEAKISQDSLFALLIIWLEYALSLIFIGEKPTSSRDPFGIRRKLKYVFELAKILKIDDFDEILRKIIEKYSEIVNISPKNVYETCLQHKI